MYSTVCKNYKSVCSSSTMSAYSYNDQTSYFSCTQFQIGSSYGYVGPHCRSDGKTIGLGIYKDPYCGVYIGDTIDLSQYMTVDDKALSAYVTKSCISCNGIESFDLLTDDQVQNVSGTVCPVCGALFQYSAKCHKHMGQVVTTYHNVSTSFFFVWF